MTDPDLRARIVEQFGADGASGHVPGADVWRLLEHLLETEAFLNLGYSPWYLPHAVGSSQRRLAAYVGDQVATALATTAGESLVDVGCGRGGVALTLADEFGLRVTGVDLVASNVARARANAAGPGTAPASRRPDAEFVVGDATALPVATDGAAAVTAVDSLVYVPERAAAVEQLADVLAPGGVAVVTDLVTLPRRRGVDLATVDAFADAWDMPRPATVAAYEEHFTETTLEVERIEDLRPHSVGRFRTWTTLFLWLVASPAGAVVERALRRVGVDPATVIEQVRRAHRALPRLGHVLLVARA